MSKTCSLRFLVISLMLGGWVLTSAAPAEAQRDFEPLFDKFSFKGELSWVGLKTTIGLYEDDLDLGGELDFENDLKLGNRHSIPSLDFEWQVGKRHRLAGRWQNLSRKSNTQALTEIEWGDETIPIDADISLRHETIQFFVDYTYYPWVKERWAVGFGLGFRWIDLKTTLSWTLETGQVEEGSQGAALSAPLPYLYVEYRRLLTEHWRMILGGGWLDVTIGDISGGQWIGRAGFEYLIGKWWSVGGAFNIAPIDADAKNINDDDGIGTLDLTANIDIWDLSLFGRVRF